MRRSDKMFGHERRVRREPFIDSSHCHISRVGLCQYLVNVISDGRVVERRMVERISVFLVPLKKVVVSSQEREGGSDAGIRDRKGVQDTAGIPHVPSCSDYYCYFRTRRSRDTNASNLHKILK